MADFEVVGLPELGTGKRIVPAGLVKRIYDAAVGVAAEGKAIRVRVDDKFYLNFAENLRRRARQNGRRAHLQKGSNDQVLVWIDTA